MALHQILGTTRHPDGHRACDIVASILQRGGLRYGDGDPERIGGNASFSQLMRHAVQCESGLTFDGDFIREGLSSFTGPAAIAEAVAVAVNEGFASAKDSTDWCSTVPLKTFKENVRATMREDHSLRPLARGGTAELLAVDIDLAESYSAVRYARHWQLDEQDIIDDNLDLVSRIPFRLAAAAKRLRADLTYSHLLDNAALSDGTELFHTDHGNFGTAALSGPNLALAIKWMRGQSNDGLMLDAEPGWLVVDHTIEETARDLLHNRDVNDVPNLKLRVEPRLSQPFHDPRDPDEHSRVQGVAGSWLLVAANGPTVEVGQRSPSPELVKWNLSHGQWGMGFGLSWDVGVKALDYRGLYLSQPSG